MDKKPSFSQKHNEEIGVVIWIIVAIILFVIVGGWVGYNGRG